MTTWYRSHRGPPGDETGGSPCVPAWCLLRIAGPNARPPKWLPWVTNGTGTMASWGKWLDMLKMSWRPDFPQTYHWLDNFFSNAEIKMHSSRIWRWEKICPGQCRQRCWTHGPETRLQNRIALLTTPGSPVSHFGSESLRNAASSIKVEKVLHFLGEPENLALTNKCKRKKERKTNT